MSKKLNWRRRESGLPVLVFRGYRHPSDALTVAQAGYLREALTMQRSAYRSQSSVIALRDLPRANGTVKALRERQQTLDALVSGLTLVLEQGYFGQYSRSTFSDGENCVPLELAFAQMKKDVSDVGAMVAAIEVAASDWSRTQPYGSSGLGRIHAAVKKIRGYYDYMHVPR